MSTHARTHARAAVNSTNAHTTAKKEVVLQDVFLLASARKRSCAIVDLDVHVDVAVDVGADPGRRNRCQGVFGILVWKMGFEAGR